MARRCGLCLSIIWAWSPVVGYLVRAVLVGWMLWAWWGVLALRRDERLLWTIAVTLAVTHTAGRALRRRTLWCLCWCCWCLMRQWARRGRGLWNVGLLAVLLIVPWVHFLVTLMPPNLENLSVFLPPIALVIITLIFTRRMWWQLTPLQR